MSDQAAPLTRTSLREHLAGHWQVPLLIVSCVMFGWGLYRLRPETPEPTFEQRLLQIEALRKAELYVEASRLAEELLADPDRTPEEAARLHRSIAETIYEAESRQTTKTPANAERLIQHYFLSVPDAAALDAGALRRVGEAWEWLDRPAEAVKAYREAVAKGVENPIPVRRRVLELQLALGTLSDDALVKELDDFLGFLSRHKGRPADVLWVADRRIEVYLSRAEYAEAEGYLESLRVSVEPVGAEAERNHLDFLVAWVVYHQGRHEEAERLLRALRNRMTVRDETDAASAWLLGRIIQLQGAPEPALSLFDDVCRTHFEGPYVVASRLGRAECLAALERHEEALASLREAIAMLPSIRSTRIVTRAAVMASATAWYENLRQAGRLRESLAYLRVAASLVDPTDVRQQAVYTERLGDLLASLAARVAAADGDGAAPADGAATGAGGEVRSLLLEAGETYLKLARLTTDREPEAAAAVWRASDCFDQAGERPRSIAVLEEFVRERPSSPRLPAALFRLGATYQACGRFREAIAQYQRCVTNHPRTPAGVSSLVMMSDCYRALGPEHAASAEQVLLSVLEEPPDRPPLLTPEAVEFRDALFRLADLYVETGQYDRAIVRLEEALTRYPEDPRVERTRFQLAEAYRRSAEPMPARMAAETNPVLRDSLVAEYRRRLGRARELYEEVIRAAEGTGEPAGGPAERARVRMSYLYRADVVFDAQEQGGAVDRSGYLEAIRLYDQAAWRYRDDPIALSAYVQMIHAYLRLGDVQHARTTLERARWILRGLPDESDTWRVTGETKQHWSEYLSWLGSSPALAAR